MKKNLLLLFLLWSVSLYSQKPNIVIIISDDQSFNSIGYTNYGKVYTPTIDMLAKNGMIFTNAHHPVTVCSPSRYTIFTGKFSGRCEGKTYLNKFPPGTETRTENNCELRPDEEHLGTILQANGYKTGFVGKSHIMEHDILSKGNWSSYGLQTYGQTDDPYDPAVSAKMKYNHDIYQSIVRSYGFDYADGIYMANLKELWNDALNVHNLEWTVDKARKFIEQEKDNPFFLYFSTTLNHGPVPWSNKDGDYWPSFDADPKLTGEGFIDTTWDFMPGRQEIQNKYVAEGFPERDAYCLLLDEGVKAIYQKISELNLEENTLIIFMPDHGMWRHGKATLYDFGLKVPMLMYWKGKIIPGSIYDGLIQTIDFLPTILDLAGIDLPSGYETDGMSLKSIIETGEGEAHTSLYGELGYSRAVKTTDWKYIAIRYPEDVQKKIDNAETFNGYQGEILEYPYLTANSHLGHYAAKNNPNYFELDQLYDLNADSAETVNVLDQHPDVVQQMRELLSEYLKSFENRPFREFTLDETDPPSRAHSPLPRNGSTNVLTSKVVRWTSEYKALSHDVYFGTSNPPPFVANQETLEFDPGDLQGATTYYWRIDEKNANGTTVGDIWSFKTGNPLATAPVNPYPEYNAVSVKKNSVLEWEKSANASYYKLYFGIGDVEYIADVYEEKYDPGYLRSNTTYFWRVDAVNEEGMVTTGTPWVFTTGYGNIAPGAYIAASSEANNSNYSAQNVNDEISQVVNAGEWKSNGESTPWLRLSWSFSSIVDKINLYDRADPTSQIVNGQIIFSDGSKLETGALPSDGSIKTFKFSPKEISSLILSVDEGIGDVGLAEIEIFDTVMYVSSKERLSDFSGFEFKPNPAPGKLIFINGLSDTGMNRIYIYDICGKIIKATHTGNEGIDLDLSSLKSGLYFIRVCNNRYDRTEKLII